MARTLTAAAALSLVAAILLLVMLGIAIQSGGITQQRFEHFMPLAEYQAQFLAAQSVITTTLIFDNLFLMAYTLAIAMSAGTLMQADTRVAGYLAIAGMLATGLLDLAENLNFLTFYATLSAGRALSEGAIAGQMWASMFKWHVAYGALLALSFVIPVNGTASAILVWSLRLVLPPVGVLIYAGPDALRPALSLARYALMLSGFVLLALVLLGHARRAEHGQA